MRLDILPENFGICLGYCGEPCPECGRFRLEEYTNGKHVCEKCGWCPENNNYVDPYEYNKMKDYEAYMESWSGVLKKGE